MNFMKKKAAVILLAALLTALLAGCGCKHQWKAADCQTPKTCTLCGATEGKVRSHQWGNTACHEPEGCVVCGTLEGIELTHEWQEDCKICIHCAYDGRPAEDRFPEVLAAGLNERWTLEAQLHEKEAAEGYVLTEADWQAMFDAEYSRIAAFKDETYQDEEAESAILRYIESIEASIAALEHFGTDSWTDEYYNGTYWEQANSLFLVDSLRPVTVAEEHLEQMKDMLVNGEIINMVRPLLEQVMFLHVDSTKTGEKYETTIKNTSSLTFDWFSLDVNLLDDAGNVLESHSIEVEDWEPEERLRFNFTVAQEFSSIEVAFANWAI